MAHRELDELDKKILTIICENARIPFLEVARECNVSGAAIHQRIQRLINMGVIKGSEFVLNPASLGYETCGFVGVFLKKASLFHGVVEELNKIPEVVEVHYTTGKYAMFLKVYAKNNRHLLSIIHDQFQNIEGISSTETIISMEEAYSKQPPIK